MSRLGLTLLGFSLAVLFAAVVFALVYRRRSKPRGTRNPGGTWHSRDIRLKTCPDCAELSVLNASTCKYCGGAFEKAGPKG